MGSLFFCGNVRLWFLDLGSVSLGLWRFRPDASLNAWTWLRGDRLYEGRPEAARQLVVAFGCGGVTESFECPTQPEVRVVIGRCKRDNG